MNNVHATMLLPVHVGDVTMVAGKNLPGRLCDLQDVSHDRKNVVGRNMLVASPVEPNVHPAAAAEEAQGVQPI